MRPPFYALLSKCGTLRAETSSYKQDRGCEQVAAEYFGDMVWVDKQRGKPGKLGTDGTFTVLTGLNWPRHRLKISENVPSVPAFHEFHVFT